MYRSSVPPARPRRNKYHTATWPPPPPLPKNMTPSYRVRYDKGMPRMGDPQVLWHGNQRGPDGKRLGAHPSRPRSGPQRASTIIGRAALAEGLAIMAGHYQPGRPVDVEQMAQTLGGRMSDDDLAATIFAGTVAATTPSNVVASPQRPPAAPPAQGQDSRAAVGRKRGRPRKVRGPAAPPDAQDGGRLAASNAWTPSLDEGLITDADLDALPPEPAGGADGRRRGDAAVAAALGAAPIALTGDALLAVDALRQIAQDPDASGAARASAARALLEMSGALGKHQRPPPPPEDELFSADVDLVSMSLAELKAFFLRCCGYELKKLRAENYELRQRLGLNLGN